MQLFWTFFSAHCEFFPKKVSSAQIAYNVTTLQIFYFKKMA